MVAQLVVLGAASAGIWLAVRWMRVEFARVDGEIRRTERVLERMEITRMPQLCFDPETGHYRPVER